MNRSVIYIVLLSLHALGCVSNGRNTRGGAIFAGSTSICFNDLNFSAWAIHQGVVLSVANTHQDPIVVGTQLHMIYANIGPPVLRSSDLHIHMLKGVSAKDFSVGRHFIHGTNIERDGQLEIVKAKFFVYICNVDEYLEAITFDAVMDVLNNNVYGLSFIWDKGQIQGRLVGRINFDGSMVSKDPVSASNRESAVDN